MICNFCKNTFESLYIGKKCHACHLAYKRAWSNAKYASLRRELVLSMGGICVDCGATSGLEFDHVIASEKQFDVGQILNHSREVVEEELKKCVLRCHACHAAKSRVSDWGEVQHGGGLTGKRKCKCRPCIDKANAYSKEWKRSRRLKAMENRSKT